MEQAAPYLQVGVKILLKNQEGKYLLIRRNPKKYPEIGPKWDIVGGRIDIGVSLLENLKREVKEETGLEILGTPQLVSGQDILHVERFPGRHVVRLTYIGNTSGVPVIDEESLEWKWFTVTEIKTLSSDELDQFFAEVIERALVS